MVRVAVQLGQLAAHRCGVLRAAAQWSEGSLSVQGCECSLDGGGLGFEA